MTDKEFVLSKVPFAAIGKTATNMLSEPQTRYFCNFYWALSAGIWKTMYLANFCRTENEAWAAAKHKIENTAHIDHYLHRAIKPI